MSVINSKNLLAESSSVENNNDNPLLFDERVIRKQDEMSQKIYNFNFDSQIKANPYDLKDLNSSVNESLNTYEDRA